MGNSAASKRVPPCGIERSPHSRDLSQRRSKAMHCLDRCAPRLPQVGRPVTASSARVSSVTARLAQPELRWRQEHWLSARDRLYASRKSVLDVVDLHAG